MTALDTLACWNFSGPRVMVLELIYRGGHWGVALMRAPKALPTEVAAMRAAKVAAGAFAYSSMTSPLILTHRVMPSWARVSICEEETGCQLNIMESL